MFKVIDFVKGFVEQFKMSYSTNKPYFMAIGIMAFISIGLNPYAILPLLVVFVGIVYDDYFVDLVTSERHEVKTALGIFTAVFIAPLILAIVLWFF